MRSTIPLLALALAAALLGACASAPKSTASEPVFYPPAPAEPRLQFLARFTTTEDVEAPSTLARFITGEVAAKGISRAHGVAWHDGRIYVCDPGVADVLVLDLKAQLMRAMDADDQQRFKKPIEIAIAADGWKYVTDTVLRQVVVYDAQDRYQGAYGDPERWRPVGVAVTTDRIYVTDVANHAVVILDRATGEELSRFGTKGGNDDQFFYPVAITLGPEGDLYVTDSFNCCIKQLKPDGTFVRKVGSPGVALGQFGRPRGVAIDREGRIFALDASFANCQIFDSEGRLLLFFGEPGPLPDSINMPAEVIVSYDAVPLFSDRVADGYALEYVVFITSQTGPNKVSAYGMLRPKS